MNTQILTRWTKTLDEAMRITEPLLAVPKGHVAPVIRIYEVKDAYLVVMQS